MSPRPRNPGAPKHCEFSADTPPRCRHCGMSFIEWARIEVAAAMRLERQLRRARNGAFIEAARVY